MRTGVIEIMKTIETKYVVIEYVVPESDDELKDMRRIMREVEEQDMEQDTSRFRLELPDKLRDPKNSSTKKQIS
jgi:aspartate/glutamate racemase